MEALFLSLSCCSNHFVHFLGVAYFELSNELGRDRFSFLIGFERLSMTLTASSNTFGFD